MYHILHPAPGIQCTKDTAHCFQLHSVPGPVSAGAFLRGAGFHKALIPCSTPPQADTVSSTLPVTPTTTKHLASSSRLGSGLGATGTSGLATSVTGVSSGLLNGFAAEPASVGTETPPVEQVSGCTPSTLGA